MYWYFYILDLLMNFILHCIISECQFCEKRAKSLQTYNCIKNVFKCHGFCGVFFICSWKGIEIKVDHWPGPTVTNLLSLKSWVYTLNLCTSLLDLRIKGFELKTTQSEVLVYTLNIVKNWIEWFETFIDDGARI